MQAVTFHTTAEKDLAPLPMVHIASSHVSGSASVALAVPSNDMTETVITAAFVGPIDIAGRRDGLGLLAIRPPIAVGSSNEGTSTPVPEDESASEMPTSDNFNSRAERNKGIRAGGDTAFLCQWSKDLPLLAVGDTSDSSPVVMIQGGSRSMTVKAEPSASGSLTQEGKAFVPKQLYIGDASLLSGGATSRNKLNGLAWAHRQLRVLPHGIGTVLGMTNHVEAKGGEANLQGQRALRRPAAKASGQSQSYVGEFELGERTGFGAEIDFSRVPTQKPNSGGGVTADTLVSSSNPETSACGELGACSDCPCCMATRSSAPLCDLSLPYRVMPSYEQHPIGYVGPYHTDAREGSGMLYLYGGGGGSYGATSAPPVAVSGFWRDGQMVTGSSLPSAARQLSNSVDVALLRTSHRLTGTEWDFGTQSIGFKTMLVNTRKGTTQRHTDGIWEAHLSQLDQHLSSATMGLADEDDQSPRGSASNDDQELQPQQANGRSVDTFSVVTPRCRLWRAMAKAVRSEAFSTTLTSFGSLYTKLHAGQHEKPILQQVNGGEAGRLHAIHSAIGAFVSAEEALVMFSPTKIAPIPASIPAPSHFQGAPIPSTIPANTIPTVASYLRACDDLTSFVVSFRFRLMSLVAAANIQSQMYGPYVKGMRAAGRAADLLDSPGWCSLSESTSPGGSGHGSVPSTRRLASIAATLNDATLVSKVDDEAPHLEYSDEVLFYSWDLIYPIGAPLLEELAGSTFEARAWAADLELAAQRLVVDSSPKLVGDKLQLAALPYATRALKLYENSYESTISYLVAKGLGGGKQPTSQPASRFKAAVSDFMQVFMSGAKGNAGASQNILGTRVSLQSAGCDLQADEHLSGSPLNNTSMASHPLFAALLNPSGAAEPTSNPSLARHLSVLVELQAAVAEASLKAAQLLIEKSKSLRRVGDAKINQNIDGENELRQQLLLERQFTESFVKGCLAILFLQMAKRGPNSEALRGRIRRSLSKLLVLDQITRNGVKAASQSGATSCMPHWVRAGIQVRGKGDDSTLLLGKVEYDELVPFGVVSVFLEALETGRGRRESISAMDLPLPSIRKGGRPDSLCNDLVDRALLNFHSLGSNTDAKTDASLSTRFTEFAPTAPCFFSSRSQDGVPGTTMNLSGSIPSSSTTAQLLRWRLFDWIATGNPRPPKPFYPPVAPSIAAAAGHNEPPVTFTSKAGSCQAIAVPVAHTQPSQVEGSQMPTAADASLWVAACAATTLAACGNREGPLSAVDRRILEATGAESINQLFGATPPQYKPRGTEGFALRASELLLRTQVAADQVTTESTGNSDTTVDRPAAVQSIVVPGYAVASPGTATVAPSNASASQFQATCRLLSELGSLDLTFDSKTAKISKLQPRRLDNYLPIASTEPQESIPASLTGSDPTEIRTASKAAAAFAGTSSDDEADGKGSKAYRSHSSANSSDSERIGSVSNRSTASLRNSIVSNNAPSLSKYYVLAATIEASQGPKTLSRFGQKVFEGELLSTIQRENIARACNI